MQLADQLQQDHLQNFMWKNMTCFIPPPILKSTSPALNDWDPGILQSTFGCMVQFSNMTKAARLRVKIRRLIFLMFSLGGGSETWKRFRETY